MNTGLITGLSVLAVIAMVIWFLVPAHAESLRMGEPAPTFVLPDASGKPRDMQEFRGEWLLLYFYPKDDTPGCTKEACAFRDGYLELRQRGVQVVGISLDDTASHRAFAEKYKLPFPLLSDVEGKVAKQYDAIWSLGPMRFAKRHSFLIDNEGKLAKIYRSVDPDTHYKQVLSDLPGAH